MKTTHEKSQERGHANHGWLNTHHSFSFANYYNPSRIHFGALRVLNDDTVLFGYGFDMHPHKNMEVISIPIQGALHHIDSTGKDDVIRPGPIQVMSTGTGVSHSEFNDVEESPLEFLQIWIIPDKTGTEPDYRTYEYAHLMRKNELLPLIAPDGTAPASIQQQAWFSIGDFEEASKLQYKLHGPEMGMYLFVISGSAKLGELQLSARDGVGIEKTDTIDIEIASQARLLLIEVPMIKLH